MTEVVEVELEVRGGWTGSAQPRRSAATTCRGRTGSLSISCSGWDSWPEKGVSRGKGRRNPSNGSPSPLLSFLQNLRFRWFRSGFRLRQTCAIRL